MFVERIIADAKNVEKTERRKPSIIEGEWGNRLGSTMKLTVDEHHRIHGTFHTAVGMPEGSPGFPVVGFVEGDALSFCVDFGQRGSVAAWSGHHVSDEHGERLVTLWHLVQPVQEPHGETDVWRALMAGSNEFARL